MEDTTLTYKGHYIEIWQDTVPQSPNYLDPLVQVAVAKRDSMGYIVPLSDSTLSAWFPLETVRRILEEGTDDPDGYIISDGWWTFGVAVNGPNELRRHRLPKPGEFHDFALPGGIVAVSHDVVPTKENAVEVADRILETHNRIMVGMVYGYTIYSGTACIHRSGLTCDIDRVIANALADVDDLVSR
jgi:hypothetical protein